jgi:hypothetical protein
MSDLSNLYVEKINSEHPIAVWMLNEDIDYVSLITEEERRFANTTYWEIFDGSAADEVVLPTNTPFPESATTKLTASVPDGPTGSVTIQSKDEADFTIFSEELANFSWAFFVYNLSPFIDSVTYGYKYYDPITELFGEEVVIKPLSPNGSQQWDFIANTFRFPPSNVEDIYYIIRFNTKTGGGATDYDVLLNGISFAQWSEEFHKTSLGLEPVPIPTDIAIDANMQVMPAFPYGSSNQNAYYTACRNDRKIYSINFGIPLVYGSDNTTKIYPHQHVESGELVTYPSLLFPGYGLLNDSGRYNEYTAEMWVRLNTDAVEPRKFFGPIVGSDGLYVEGPFLTLVIGNRYASHYVGEWYRPMLIHIRLIRNNASLLVNGEEVLSFEYNDARVDLPKAKDSQGRSQDWLGFYAYNDVRPIDIDSFAIYPYSVPNEVAKRRWVWGQGVVAPETTNATLNATTAFADYSFAKYTSNYNYPDFARWSQGFFSNVEAGSSSLSLPEFDLPEISVSGVSESKWLTDNKNIQESGEERYFTFRPNAEYAEARGYLFVKDFGMLSEQVESFYGVMEATEISSENQTLFKIVDELSGDYVLVDLKDTTITYRSSIAGQSNIFGTAEIEENKKFVVGLNLSNLTTLDLPGLTRFFENQDPLSVYVGGDGATTFTGKIYRTGFDGSYNNRKIINLYDARGVFDNNEEVVEQLLRHVANYTIKGYTKYNLFFIDVAVAGYWEDYIPLSYFAKNIENNRGETNYELDAIQFNLDYPEGLEINALET